MKISSKTSEEKRLIVELILNSVLLILFLIGIIFFHQKEWFYDKYLPLFAIIWLIYMYLFSNYDQYLRKKQNIINSQKLLKLYENNASTLEIINFASDHHLSISIVEETLKKH